MGASAARNKALSFAQGDYIQWLDADDLLAHDKISQQLKNSDSGQISRVLFSGTWAKFFFRHQRAKFVPNVLWQDLEPVEWLFRKMSTDNWMSIESWLVSRKLTEMAGPWNEKLLRDNDGEYFCRVISASEKIRFIPEAKCYCRRGHVDSISSRSNISNEKIESMFESTCFHIDCLRSFEDSERTRAACLSYIQFTFNYFYPEKHEILEKCKNIARDLGGQLLPPTLSWKYFLIRKFFGWKVARKVQLEMRKTKTLIQKNWDKVLYNLFKSERRLY